MSRPTASSSPSAATATIRGFVPGSYVRLLYDYLQAEGVDSLALLGASAAEHTRAASEQGRCPVRIWKQLLEHAASQLGDPLLGVHLGSRITPAHFGVMGYVLLSCANLGAALQRMRAYQRLLYDVNPLRTRIDDGSLVLEWGTENGRPGALVDETAITALVQFARDITARRIEVRQVCFVNPAPAQVQPYVDYYGCAVRFGEPLSSVRLPLTALALPLRKPDAALLAVLERQAQALLAELPDADDFEQAVRSCIARLLREGEPMLPRVAAELHTSPRSLHRRLEKAGLNFHRLREDTRRRLAEDYLRDARLQLVEIAQLLGYSEQSTFNRAFRRWTGTTPRAYRRGTAAATD